MLDLKDFFSVNLENFPNAAHMASYKKLQMVLLQGVEKGVWKTGSALPAERKIAEASGLSVGTVKRAMLELVHDGLLYRVQGRGTFVSGTSFAREHRRYYLLLKDFDSAESPNQVDLLSIRIVRGPTAINKALLVDPNEELFEVVRVFREDATKCVLVHSYLPTTRFAGLHLVQKERLQHVPFYIVLEEDYGTSVSQTSELFEAVLSEAYESKILEIPIDTPIIKIIATVCTQKDTPFEYRISYVYTKEKKLFRSF